MAAKVAINGFGRIGRNVFRAALNSPDLEFVAVNDLTDAATLAHLLKYDSVHGRLRRRGRRRGDNLVVNGKTIRVCKEKDPAALPWKALGIDLAIESTGRFTAMGDAAKHLAAGARKVVVSAPGKGVDLTVCMGVNEKEYDPARHHVISNASCTTNCLAPVAKVLLQEFGIVKGLMTTVHSYTNDQQILDLPHKDLRRARAAAVSMIPTTTGAAKAVALVLPQLKGQLDRHGGQGPDPERVAVDLVVETERTTTCRRGQRRLATGRRQALKGILDYCEEPLVSIDFNAAPPRRPSMPCPPRSSAATWSRCSPGTTTSGVIPTASSI